MNQTQEDLVQEAIKIIYEKYKTVEFVKGILPWAYTVLDNLVKCQNQTQNRRQKILAEQNEVLVEIYGNREEVHSITEQNELASEINRALGKLSEIEKRIFQLKLSGYSGEEIRQKLAMKRSTFDVTVWRASKKIRHCLEKKGVLSHEMH